MADSLPSQYDVTILGTGLVQSIAAAALSKAGYKVLHLDHHQNYGAEDASLTIEEVVSWANECRTAEATKDSELRYASVSYSFPASPSLESDKEHTIPESLQKSSRQYTLSLSPALIPSIGPIITALIQSGVARYSAFRLLEGTALYNSEPRAEAPKGDHIEPIASFIHVPTTKQDVFTDKKMSLPDKRRLMKFLMFAVAGNFSESAEVQGHETTQFPSFLQDKFSLPVTISNAIAFAVAHCASAEEQTLPSLERMHRYLLSSGKYGNNPFLVGHYGGSGELSQGFCRVCAVHGGTYILGRQLQSILEETVDSQQVFSVQLEDIPETLSSPMLICSADRVPTSLRVSLLKEGADHTSTAIARCIAILDGPVLLSRQPTAAVPEGTDTIPAATNDGVMDTYLLVFPPNSLAPHKHDNVVTALITGQGTMSCPQGKYLLYLTSTSPADMSAELLLRPYLDEVLSFVSPSSSQDRGRPLFEVFYRQNILANPESKAPNLVLVNSDPPHISTLTETADQAALEAERVFREAVKILKKSKQTASDNVGNTNVEEVEEIEEIDFWPPLDVHEKDDDEW